MLNNIPDAIVTEAKDNFGLGRIHIPDSRDANFPIREIAPKKLPVFEYIYWHGERVLNQGQSSECVSYSWSHWLFDSPYVRKSLPFTQNELYKQAQDIDQWQGSNYNGTSVRAGADILLQKGFIKEYRWGWSLRDLIAALYIAPVVVGTDWEENMYFPNKKGIITLGGEIAGGHAYKIDGQNLKTKMFRIKNSWGNWGRSGYAFISFKDMETLIGRQGEVCLAIENISK